MEWICVFLLAVVFTVGLVDLMRMFRFWLLRPLEEPPIVVMLRLENERECEYQLRAVLERLRWLRVPASLRLRCENSNGSAQVERILRRFAARYPMIEYGRTKDEPLSCGPKEDRG